jgi:hypothetical protein
MAENLPDELLSEILSRVIQVPDDMFSQISVVSPFGNPASVSASPVLLVCKAWLRVATPLLYNVVVTG